MTWLSEKKIEASSLATPAVSALPCLLRAEELRGGVEGAEVWGEGLWVNPGVIVARKCDTF